MDVARVAVISLTTPAKEQPGDLHVLTAPLLAAEIRTDAMTARLAQIETAVLPSRIP
jgi:hypothetical protein